MSPRHVQISRADLKLIDGALENSRRLLVNKPWGFVFTIDMARATIRRVLKADALAKRSATIKARARAKDRRCLTCGRPWPCYCDYPVLCREGR